MSTATPFRVVLPRQRGDKLAWVGAYCANPNPQTGTSVTIQDIEPQNLPPETPANMKESAAKAAAFLKTLAHEGRLMILCHLGAGERSVGELEALLELRQAAVSQMLARLREEGLVTTRREGKTIYYSLSDGNTAQVIELLYSQFCKADG